MLNLQGSLFSPGDELTPDYIFGRTVSKQQWQLCCAQALIYYKIIIKEEISSCHNEFPHTRNKIESIAAVKKLSIENAEPFLYESARLPPLRRLILQKNI